MIDLYLFSEMFEVVVAADVSFTLGVPEGVEGLHDDGGHLLHEPILRFLLRLAAARIRRRRGRFRCGGVAVDRRRRLRRGELRLSPRLLRLLCLPPRLVLVLPLQHLAPVILADLGEGERLAMAFILF